MQELERRLAQYLGVRHCVAVCSGTTALEITVRALRLQGEVIVPSFTFVAAAHALMLNGVQPVFCDISPDDHLLDPALLDGLVTPRTTGVLAVHLWGEPCHVERLSRWASLRGLRLVFDAAHAFGCSAGDRMLGGFGDAEVFSFHATKVFNTMEGGAITTSDDVLAHDLRAARNFGFESDGLTRFVGTNAKMNEIEAAMGLTNLEHLDEFIAANRRNHEAYAAGLAGIPGVTLCRPSGGGRRNWHYVVIMVEESEGPGRDALMHRLRAHGILARRHFWPGCHAMEPYRSRFPLPPHVLPATRAVASRVLCLPSGTSVSVDDIDRVCSIIRESTRSLD